MNRLVSNRFAATSSDMNSIYADRESGIVSRTYILFLSLLICEIADGAFSNSFDSEFSTVFFTLFVTLILGLTWKMNNNVEIGKTILARVYILLDQF